MRTLMCCLLLLGINVKGWSQTLISGKVMDNKKQPLAGVSISLKDTYDGGTSDSAGNFRFTTSERGSQVLVFSSIGYKTLEQIISLSAAPFAIDIVLKEEVSELKAVVISAGTFEASDRKRSAAVLTPLDIVTTASANADITGAIKTLPGAQQVGESEGLYVRGGTSAETKTFIDGTLVNNFFYSSVPNIAQRGRFSPFIFKGTVFSTGGYSALYGQALSSALILESIDLPERSSASIGIGVVGGNAGYQHLVKNNKASWGLSYGYTDLTLAFKLFKQKQDYSQIPVYHTGDANFRIKTSKNGIIKYYGYFSTNRLAFTTESIDTLGYFDKFSIKNFNFYHNLSYRESLGKSWKLNAGISYTNNHDEIQSGLRDDSKTDVVLSGLEFKNFALDEKGNYFNSKVVLERRFSGLNVFRFGGEYNYAADRIHYTTHDNQQFKNNLTDMLSAGFAETDIYITNDLAAKIGARIEHSSRVDKANFAPRVSFAYKVGSHSQASVAYGVFYQDPESRYLPTSNPLEFTKAVHYIAQYQKSTGPITFRAEIFYKKYQNLVKTTYSNGRDMALNNNGFGDAKGFELFWRDKKTIPSIDYWISYSYLDTKRDFLNFPYAIQPNFAAKHTASLVVKKFAQKAKMMINASYTYASGRPYYNIGFDGNDYKFNDKGTIPDYHNVGFAVNYLPFIGRQNPKSYAVYVLSISNLFYTKQVYGYQYSYNGFRKVEIVPTTRTFVYLGVFISIGTNRSDEVINNNL